MMGGDSTASDCSRDAKRVEMLGRSEKRARFTKVLPYKTGGQIQVCRELSCREAAHEVKHTAAFHASPSHHHHKLNFLLRASFMNVVRCILYYDLVARLSANVRLQGKAEEVGYLNGTIPLVLILEQVTIVDC